jgi:hypothetical protein
LAAGWGFCGVSHRGESFGSSATLPSIVRSL